MIVATWNVNSITVRLPHILEWVKTHRPNVVCLQETKAIDLKFPHQAFADIGYQCEFFGQPTYSGVAIISDQSIINVRKGFIDDDDSHQKRLIEAEIDSVKIINVYIPNGSEVGSEKYEYKLQWLKKLKQHILENHDMEKKVLLCGDFNIATDDIDCYNADEVRGTIMVSDVERALLAEIKMLGFVDIFRVHNQESGQFSWWDYRQAAFRRNLGFRIDHIWTSPSLAEICTKVWIDKDPRKLERPSDHTPVVAEFK